MVSVSDTSTGSGTRSGSSESGSDHNGGSGDNAPTPESVTVTQARVACDGGDAALGHPRVFLNLLPDGVVECPYCDRRFVLSPDAAGGAGH